MIEWKEIAMGLLGLALGGLSWWLKNVANRVEKNYELNLKQEGELKALEVKHADKIDNLKEITETQIGSLANEMRLLVRTLEKQNELTEKRLNKIENK